MDTTPLGRVLGEVIARGEGVGVGAGLPAVPIVRVKEAEAVCPPAPVTATVNVLVPALTGVPDRMPELVKPRPELQAPEQPRIAQV